jgi:hypothetical protein
VVIIAGGAISIYDANLGDWVDIGALTLNSDAPLEAFDLAPLLAVRIASDFRLEPTPFVVAMASSVRMALGRHAPPTQSLDTNLFSRPFNIETDE